MRPAIFLLCSGLVGLAVAGLSVSSAPPVTKPLPGAASTSSLVSNTPPPNKNTATAGPSLPNTITNASTLDSRQWSNYDLAKEYAGSTFFDE
jgi:hypothetical protein